MVLGAIGGKVPIPGPFGLRACCAGLADLLKSAYCSCSTVEGKRPLGFHHRISVSSCHPADLSPGTVFVRGMAVRTGFPVFRTWTLGEEVFLKRKAGRHALC